MYQHQSLAVALLAGAAALACGRDSPVRPTVVINAAPAVLLAAGDIGDCQQKGAALTGPLLDAHGGIVVALGDLAYPHGRREDFANCFDPYWGRHRRRMRAILGNHDYESPGAAGFFEYFGAGSPYYTFTAGPWQVLALDSNQPLGAGSPQFEWLRAVIQREPGRCSAALMHHPLFTSGPNGSNPQVRDAWQELYAAGVEIVLSGHDHLYERFAEQDSTGRANPGRGIRQFVVGTGGALPYRAVGRAPNSEASGEGFGILKLTLGANDYVWEFLPAEGTLFRDAGRSACH